MHKSRTHSGITLIELMVVVAIVGILAAIAYPTYQAQVRKSRRAAAQAFLMDAAARQHQWMLDVRRYAEDFDELKIDTPPELVGFYTFSVPEAGASFTLMATAEGGQAKDGVCAELKLNSTGKKEPEKCW